MQQMFPQIESPNKSNIMRDVGLPIILVIVTLLGSIIAAIVLGTTHVVDLTWPLFIMGGIMLAVTAFFAWYSIRTRQKLQEQYNKDIADFKSDVLAFKNDIRQMREQETRQLNDWEVSFSQASDKTHRERTEELKRQCMEAIGDAESRMDSKIGNALSIFKGSVESYDFAVDSYREQLIHALKRMDALEERLKKEPLADNTDQSPEVEIPPA